MPRPNLTRDPAPGHVPSAKETSFRFRDGLWTPQAVLELQLAKKISPTESQLLVLIDLLSKNGRPCFATNGYLARSLNVHPMYVSGRIARLKSLGLVLVLRDDGGHRLLTVRSPSDVGLVDKGTEGTASPLGGVQHHLYHKVLTPLLRNSVNTNKGKGGAARRPPVPPLSPPKEVAVRPTVLTEVPPSRRDKSRRAVPEPVDRDRCKRLRAYVASRGWFVSRSPKKWEDAFGVLRRRLGPGHGQIDAVLDFYVKSQISHPKVCNAKELLACWEWLTRLMEKQTPVVTVTPEASRVARRLAMMHWPKGSEEQLATAVQLSLDRLQQFKERLSGCNSPLAAKVRSRLADPLHFAEQWLVTANKRVRNWKDWSGRLLDLAVRVDCPQFQQEGRDWAQRATGRARPWDELMEEVGRESTAA